MAASEAVRLRSMRPFQWSILAQAMFRELDRCSPKAKVTRSNRVGRASFFVPLSQEGHLILQRDIRARTETPALRHSSE
jgi:hypothetical protein